MVWYFDFCSSFQTNDLVFNTNRYFIMGCMALQMLLFTVVRVIATCYYQGRAPTEDENLDDSDAGAEQKMERMQEDDGKDNTQKICVDQGMAGRSQSNDSTFHNTSPPESRDESKPLHRRGMKGKLVGFFQKLDIENTQRRFSLYFGHHAISVGTCLMYCPFYPVSLACIVYLFVGLLLLFLMNTQYKKLVACLWGFGCLINCGLLFAGGTFIGLMNYDIDGQTCYGSIISL